MEKFKKDGVYLKMTNSNEEGYFISGKDGKLIKHKYGLFEKVFDVFRHGKTREISYTYIYLYYPKGNFENNPLLYIGSVSGELTQIIDDFKRSSQIGTDFHRQNYLTIEDSEITYLDKKNRECTIIASTDELSITLYNFSFYNDTKMITNFKFYSLPAY